MNASQRLQVMVYNFRDCVEGHLHNHAIRAFHFNAWLGERLRRLHASHDAADAAAVMRNNFDIVLAIERLERGESFRNFHFYP